MLKFGIINLVLLLVGLSAQARSNEVMGIIAQCDCIESTIDGQREIGKVSNTKAARTESYARKQAYQNCASAANDSLSISIVNCQYIKVIDAKISKGKFKRRVERIKDDEENNLHNDLLSTL